MATERRPEVKVMRTEGLKSVDAQILPHAVASKNGTVDGTAKTQQQNPNGSRPKAVPELSLSKVSENSKLGAPATVDRLLSVLRTRRLPASETSTFQDFEGRVNELLGSKDLDPGFRVHTFYDEAIIPSGSAGATPRTTRPVGGETSLEIIFGFFCGRQQPGSGGMSSDVTFDDIAAANVCMSFPELIKFTNMMFTDIPFTRTEMSWFMTKAKQEPLSNLEGNWHGDSDGDVKLLNFVEWLSCVLRMALVGYGTLGFSPEDAIQKVADVLMVQNLILLKQRLYKIARTNGGFGAWTDPTMPFEAGTPLALSVKRPKPIAEFMLSRSDMLSLQDKLLQMSRSEKNRIWVPFDGPYISIVVPHTGHKPHLFRILVQNNDSKPRNLSFRLHNLPFLRTQYKPCKATILSAGMQCEFELAAFIQAPGDYSGEIHFTDKNGQGTFAISPVYIRVLNTASSGKLRALTTRERNPIVFEGGSMSHRIQSPSARDPLSPLIQKTLEMLPPKPNTMDWNKTSTVSSISSFAVGLCLFFRRLLRKYIECLAQSPTS
jgi:hypothetical protein